MACESPAGDLVVIVENGCPRAGRRCKGLANSFPTAKEYLLMHERGAYTTCRTFEQLSVLFLNMHISRLADSIATIRRDVLGDPRSINKESFSAIGLRDPIVEALKKGLVCWFSEKRQLPLPLRPAAPVSSSPAGDAVDEIRIYILVTVGAHEAADGHVLLVPNVCVLMEPLTSLSGHSSSAVVVEVPGVPPRSAAGAKDSGWVRERVPLERSKGADAEEVILQTSNGALMEGLSSNFFVVMDDGRVRTAEEGVLSGTVRKAVLEVLGETGVICDLRPPSLSERSHWREAFITSTSRLVMPVHQIRVWESHQVGVPPSYVLRFAYDDRSSSVVRLAREVQARLGSRHAEPLAKLDEWAALIAI